MRPSATAGDATPLDEARPPKAWHLVTGEYPPDRGGVADYSALLARALVVAGQEAHVWCGGDPAGADDGAGGVAVHRVAGRFGPAGLARFDRELGGFAGPRTILVQYVPHAYGWRAMNLPFAAWVARRAGLGDEVRVMFHEVAYPWVARPLRHNVLAAANRAMVALMLRACSRAYVSIPGWLPILRRLGGGRLPILWTPVPSNVPSEASPVAVESRREGLTGGDPGALVVGHFGTYSGGITRMLAPVLGGLLGRRPEVRILLIGAGGDRWLPELDGGRTARVSATGAMPAAEVAESLRACDLLIQPFPDGVSSRRGSVMAALANGVPVVTTTGALSEPVWAGGAVAVAAAGDADRLYDLAAGLLDSPGRRADLGRSGRRLYEERFAIRHTVAALLGPAGGAEMTNPGDSPR